MTISLYFLVFCSKEKNITSVAPTYASLLSMKSELNFNRLSKVLDTYELQVYVNHPRFMELLNRSFVAYERLEVLKKLNMRCYTLNQLITSDESFIKYEKSVFKMESLLSQNIHFILYFQTYI